MKGHPLPKTNNLAIRTVFAAVPFQVFLAAFLFLLVFFIVFVVLVFLIALFLVFSLL